MFLVLPPNDVAAVVVGTFHAPVAATASEPLAANQRPGFEGIDGQARLATGLAGFLVGKRTAHGEDGGGAGGAELREFDGQDTHRGDRLCGAALRRQGLQGSAQVPGRIRSQGFEPETFQAFARAIIIPARAAMPGGGAGFVPACGAVAGALEARGTDEGLGEQGSVAVFLLPPRDRWRTATVLGKDATGEIGLRVQQAEALAARRA